MKTVLTFIMTLCLGASYSLADDNKLEELLDRAFDKEQARIMKGRDKDRDGKMSLPEFKSLYGEGGAQRWIPVFKKHCGDDEALDLKEFQAVRRQIHLGGGNEERKPSLENRFKHSKLGKAFRAYDKNADPAVVRRIAGWVKEHMPGLDPEPAFASTCVAAQLIRPGDPYALRREFLLDHAPPSVEGHDDVVICATGWVFKLIPLVGRICADLVCDGTTSYDISPFRISDDTLR